MIFPWNKTGLVQLETALTNSISNTLHDTKFDFGYGNVDTLKYEFHKVV